MIQTIATMIAMLIAVAALIFTAVVMFKIFGKKKEKQPKQPKMTSKQKKMEAQKTSVEPEITLSAKESKVTGFELDDDD